jgi:DNA-binding MarR family transcriptional regulator
MEPDIELDAYSLLAGASGLMRRLAKDLPDKELSITERMTLNILNRNKRVMPSQLASMASFSTQLTSQVTANLIKLGYAEKKASNEDKRTCYITLTPKGVQRVEAGKAKAGKWLLTLVKQSLDAQDISLLKQTSLILQKLANATIEPE